MPPLVPDCCYLWYPTLKFHTFVLQALIDALRDSRCQTTHLRSIKALRHPSIAIARVARTLPDRRSANRLYRIVLHSKTLVSLAPRVSGSFATRATVTSNSGPRFRACAAILYSMGRRKIEIRPIKDDRNRSVYAHCHNLASPHNQSLTWHLFFAVPSSSEKVDCSKRLTS